MAERVYWRTRVGERRWERITRPHPNSDVGRMLTTADVVWQDGFGNSYKFTETNDG